MRTKSALCLAAGLLLSASACRQNPPESAPLPIRGALVYVADRDGKDGLMAGDFGDLMLLDSAHTQPLPLTRDDDYDALPTWSPGCTSILFESKRGSRSHRITGLSAKSEMYVLDRASGEVEPFGASMGKAFPSLVGDRHEIPSWSPSGKKVVY